MIFLVLIPVSMINTGLTPLLLATTPPEYLGRVIAVLNPASQAASMLSIVIGGWLASTVLHGFHATIGGVHFGSIDTIFLFTGLLVVAAGVYAMFALPPEPAPLPGAPG
jgi:hypothetical protein